MSTGNLVLTIKGELMGKALAGIPVRIVPRTRGSRPAMRVVELNHEQRIALEAGGYMIEARLPSGERISGMVRVTAGEDSALTLQMPKAANEWMQWARLTTTKARRVLQRGPQTELKPTAPLSSIPPPMPPDWTLLVDRKGVIGTTPSLHGMRPDSHATGDLRSLQIGFTDHALEWARQALEEGWRFYVQEGSSVACLPMPWFTDTTVAPLQVIVDRFEGPSVIVQDSRRAAILSFLAEGDFVAARCSDEIVPAASEALYGKQQSPLAAAAGGYILLQLRKFDELRNWIKNLADWFEWLPDGAILHATHLLRTRPDAYWDEARAYLIKGASRGVPLFSLGVRMLREGLAMLAADKRSDEALAKTAAFADELSARADPDCIFTWLAGSELPKHETV